MRIIYNARVTTNDPRHPAVTALAIDHGRIIASGDDTTILSEFSQSRDKIDLLGQAVLPGLTDAHIHLEHYAVSLEFIDCEVDTRAECIRRVAERVKNTPPGAWIRGHGWNQNVWPEGFGSVKELDEVAPNHPVYLTAKSLHAGWANSAALRLAGIHANTPDPQDGKISRDEHGKPTGILLESAMQLVENSIPAPSPQEFAHLLHRAQHNLWQLGLTGVHDYDGTSCFSALQILDQADQLRLRVVKGIPLPNLPHAIEIGLRTGFGSQFLRIGSVKLFADGALGPHTAAMLAPYEDDLTNTGILFLDGEQIYAHGQKAVSNGISVAVHAIGDRANHEVLNAYAQLRALETARGIPHLRHRIEHVQCLHPDDLRRLADLDVIASVQPIHATSDMFIADRYWGKRSAGAYAYKSLLQLGTHLSFGSDAPVELPNPWLGIHAAVTRQRLDGTPGPQGWYPAERLSLSEALHGYTTGPAFAAGLENTLGQLAPGYCADLIVLAQSPFDITPTDLYQVKPVATMVAGEWVWQRE